MARFKIAFENKDDQVIDHVDNDPANSNVDVAGINVDESPEYEIEKDIAEGDPSVGLDEVQEMAERVVAIEEALNEIADELGDNDRVLEVVDGLEDVQAIVENTPDGETVDIPMLQTAANMAVAGTDADAQDIIPALEAFKDKQLAVEAIGEKIKGALSSVVESIKNIGSKGLELVKSIFSVVKYLEDGIKSRASKIGSINSNVSFTVPSSRYFQKNKDSYVADGKDYIASLSEASKFYTAFSTSTSKLFAAFDGSIFEWYTTIGADAKKANEKLYNALVKDFGQGLKSLPGVTETSSNKSTQTFNSPVMLGGVSLTTTLPRHVIDFGGKTSEIKATINETQYKFGKDYIFHNKSNRSIDFNLSKNDLNTIVKLSSTLLQDVKKFLDASAKSFKVFATLNAGSNPFGGIKSIQGQNVLETGIFGVGLLLINKGQNAATSYLSFTRAYSENLIRSAFIVLDAALKANGRGVATEDYSMAMEGIGGGLFGVLKQAIPGYGIISASADRKKAQAITAEIQRVAKEIVAAKNQALNEAKNDGKISDTDYETYSDANAEDIVKWSIKDVIPFLATVRSYQAGSKVQDLSKELKVKLKELESLSKPSDDANLSQEGFTGGIGGLLAGMIPVAGLAANSAMKNEIVHKQKEIEAVAKEIERVKNGACEEARKTGKIDEATYKVAREVDAEAIIEGAILTIIPVVNIFSIYKSGSKLQDLSKDLKNKIAELKELATAAKANSGE